jgi:hypothetical protein
MDGGTALERVLDGTPGPTVADDTLKRDILSSIEKAEKAFGAQGSPSLVQVRQLPKDHGTYREVWLVKRDRQNVAYTIFLTASADGGVDFDVKGPWE